MNQLRISILQTDIVWENKQDNLRHLHEKLKRLRGKTEIVVLPETFSTGFSMNTCHLAEPITGETITTLRQWATDYQLAITGSYIACEESSVPDISSSYYNRAFFLTPEGDAHFYDKRHLFRMAVKLNISQPVTDVLLFLTEGGIYFCSYVTIYVFLFGAVM